MPAGRHSSRAGPGTRASGSASRHGALTPLEEVGPRGANLGGLGAGRGRAGTWGGLPAASGTSQYNAPKREVCESGQRVALPVVSLCVPPSRIHTRRLARELRGAIFCGLVPTCTCTLHRGRVSMAEIKLNRATKKPRARGALLPAVYPGRGDVREGRPPLPHHFVCVWRRLPYLLHLSLSIPWRGGARTLQHKLAV